MKELDLQDKVLYVKVIKEALKKWECEEFQEIMQHNYKLRIYK